MQNVIAPPKQKSKSESVQKEQGSAIDSQKVTPAPDVDTKDGDSTPDADSKEEKPPSMDEKAVENGSVHDNKSEDGSARSAPNSPFASSVIESPKEHRDSNFGKAAGFDASPRDKDTQYRDSNLGKAAGFDTSPRDKDALRYCQLSFFFLPLEVVFMTICWAKVYMVRGSVRK